MIKFLQDVPPGAVAVGTVVIIALAFILKPGKEKVKPVPVDEWTMGEHYAFVRSLIVTSISFAELDEARPMADKFLALYCSENNTELQKYYSRLIKAISKKEIQLLKSIAV